MVLSTFEQRQNQRYDMLMSGPDPLRAEDEGTAPARTVPYEIIGRFADGAMGQVYLARLDDADHRPFHLVMKRIRPELQADPEMVMMFQDEARIAAQLNHPNIVRLYEIGELDGSLFLAMELVEGVTLEHLLATLGEQRRFIPIDLGLTIALGTLEALEYAHDFADADGRPLRIVHRDVSPQNLMVSYGGDVKLLDFGVTRAEGRLHQTLPGLLKGKLAYMPPEAIEGRGIDSRADLFSLGAVLYELLLLKHPFFGSTDAMVLRSIVEHPPIPPSELDPNFPDELAQILLAALAKDPEHRVPSAKDMKTAIHRFLERTGCSIDSGYQRLGQFLRELYADRVELHEHAKSIDDDALLLQALRGFVRRPLRRGDGAPGVRPPEGPYGLPHSQVELEYARVPTADLPVLRRTNPGAEPSVARPKIDLEEAFSETSSHAAPRGFETRLGRYQLFDVLEQTETRVLQRARFNGALGFRKDVLVRRLPPHRATDPESMASFVREAKIRANLHHPHVEVVLDFDDQPEVHFVVEPLDGWSLEQLLNAAARGHHAPPRLDVALRLMLDVVEALEYLHGLNEPIIHRGLEPRAILLHRSGRARLTGFEVARPLGSRVPHSSTSRPDLDRVAPEIVAPQRALEGRSTDAYGVCLLLVECLLMRRAFLRDEPAAVMQAVLHGIGDEVLDELPAAVRPAIVRGLAVDPARRFPDMSALRTALVAAALVADRATVRDWFAES